jgi:aminopeptidase
MSDARIERFARILVDYSAAIGPGDRVLIEATTAAEELVRAIYSRVLEVGGQPQIQFELTDQDELLYKLGNDSQLEFVPPLRKLAYETFESRFRIHSQVDPRGLSDVDPKRVGRRQKALSELTATQMRRGAAENFRWVTTLFPTSGYAAEAGMDQADYEDFVYRACHANENDPVAYWKKVEAEQARLLAHINGHEQVTLHGPNVDLRLSIKDRTFLNSCGRHNMPDGEVYTGPVESSVNGWVRFTYPAIYQGSAAEGVELSFVDGRVEKATAKKNEAYLLEMLEADAGSRYLGEFAIGTNFEIDRFTGNILFDEKIGGTFHMALGAGYPETGSVNKSAIHWDMICDLRSESEIAVDGEVIYRNGKFVV